MRGQKVPNKIFWRDFPHKRSFFENYSKWDKLKLSFRKRKNEASETDPEHEIILRQIVRPRGKFFYRYFKFARRIFGHRWVLTCSLEPPSFHMNVHSAQWKHKKLNHIKVIIIMSDDKESLQIYCKANNSTLFTYDSTSQLSMIVNRTRILKII